MSDIPWTHRPVKKSSQRSGSSGYPSRQAAVKALVKARMTHSHEVKEKDGRYVIVKKNTGF